MLLASLSIYSHNYIYKLCCDVSHTCIHQTRPENRDFLLFFLLNNTLRYIEEVGRY